VKLKKEKVDHKLWLRDFALHRYTWMDNWKFCYNNSN